MPALRGYGSIAFYRHIDAGAPSVLSSAAAAPDRSANIAPAYPFGFYALEAVWMKVVAFATGSLVATFFAARLLCVFLTMAGLYFNYLTARNVGVPPWPSVAVLVAAAFFPLTTLVSSYVQPDDLAYALVSAALFLATQLKRSTRPLRTTARTRRGVGLSRGDEVSVLRRRCRCPRSRSWPRDYGSRRPKDCRCGDADRRS